MIVRATAPLRDACTARRALLGLPAWFLELTISVDRFKRGDDKLLHNGIGSTLPVGARGVTHSLLLFRVG